MEAEPGSGKKQERRLWVQADLRKISEAAKVVLIVMKAHAQPVVDGLHHQVNVFGSFQFQNGQAAVTSNAEQIDDAAVAGRKCRNLRIDLPRVEPCVDS